MLLAELRAISTITRKKHLLVSAQSESVHASDERADSTNRRTKVVSGQRKGRKSSDKPSVDVANLGGEVTPILRDGSGTGQSDTTLRRILLDVRASDSMGGQKRKKERSDSEDGTREDDGDRSRKCKNETENGANGKDVQDSDGEQFYGTLNRKEKIPEDGEFELTPEDAKAIVLPLVEEKKKEKKKRVKVSKMRPGSPVKIENVSDLSAVIRELKNFIASFNPECYELTYFAKKNLGNYYAMTHAIDDMLENEEKDKKKDYEKFTKCDYDNAREVAYDVHSVFNVLKKLEDQGK